MQGAGLIIVAIGFWLTYCGYAGLDPVKTVLDILRNPAQAQEIVSGAKKNLPTNTGAGSIVAYARAQIGKPYVFGASGPNAFDCSGLTKAAYATIGINLPHNSVTQLLVGRRINLRADLQPGDLVFPTVVGAIFAGHVQIYSGNGNIIEAADVGIPVRERSMWGVSGERVTACRPYASK